MHGLKSPRGHYRELASTRASACTYLPAMHAGKGMCSQAGESPLKAGSVAAPSAHAGLGQASWQLLTSLHACSGRRADVHVGGAARLLHGHRRRGGGGALRCRKRRRRRLPRQL